jgi:hypothetical protein
MLKKDYQAIDKRLDSIIDAMKKVQDKEPAPGSKDGLKRCIDAIILGKTLWSQIYEIIGE